MYGIEGLSSEYYNQRCVNCGKHKNEDTNSLRFNYKLKGIDYTVYEALISVISRLRTFTSSSSSSSVTWWHDLQVRFTPPKPPKEYPPEPRLLCGNCAGKLKTWFESSLLFTNRTIKDSYIDQRFRSDWNNCSSATNSDQPAIEHEDNCCYNCQTKSKQLTLCFQAEIDGDLKDVGNSTALFTILNPAQALRVNLQHVPSPNLIQLLGSLITPPPLKLCRPCTELLCGLYVLYAQFFKLTAKASKVDQLIQECMREKGYQVQSDLQPQPSSEVEIKTELFEEEDVQNFMDASADCPLDEELPSYATEDITEVGNVINIDLSSLSTSDIFNHPQQIQVFPIFPTRSNEGSQPEDVTYDEQFRQDFYVEDTLSGPPPAARPRSPPLDITKLLTTKTKSTINPNKEEKMPRSHSSSTTADTSNNLAEDILETTAIRIPTVMKINKHVFRQKKRRRSNRKENENGPLATFACIECPKRFISAGDLSGHLFKTHKIGGKNPCTCPTCGLLCTNRSGLKKHQYKIHKQKLFNCIVCLSKFGLTKELREHVKQEHSSGTNVKCTECGKDYTKVAHLKVHKQLIHVEPTIKCTAVGCDKVFKYNGVLKSHLKTHSTNRTREAICEICGKAYANKMGVRQHMRVAHLKQEFPCEICGRIFYCETYLKKHKAILHDAKDKFECKECGKKFPIKKYLQRHYLRTHATEEEQGGPWECDLCGQVFKLRQNLLRHKIARFHGGKGRKGYPAKNKEPKHQPKWKQQAHAQLTGERVEINGKVCYKCEICTYKFASELHLKYHKARKHSKVKFGTAKSKSMESPVGLDMNLIDSSRPSLEELLSTNFSELNPTTTEIARGIKGQAKTKTTSNRRSSKKILTSKRTSRRRKI